MQTDKKYMFIGQCRAQRISCPFSSCSGLLLRMRRVLSRLQCCGLFRFGLCGALTHCLFLAAFVSQTYPERTAFELLKQVRKDFMDKEEANAGTATENSMSKACKKFMQPAATKYDDVAAVNKVAAVQAQVDDVKMTMEDNVQQMLRQHEKLEDLEDKADTMRSEASKFKRGAGQLASKMWWQNMRLWCIIVIITVVVLMIIIFSVCEPCRPGGGGGGGKEAGKERRSTTGGSSEESALHTLAAKALEQPMKMLKKSLPAVRGFDA